MAEVAQVPDDELEDLARQNGEASPEANVLKRVRALRAKDRQAYAFRAG